MATRTFRTIEEIELLEGCTSRDELEQRYVKRFGKMLTPETAVVQHIRMDSLWAARKTLLVRLPHMKTERNNKAKQVEVRKLQIHHKGDPKNIAFSDDAIMVKIHNRIAEIIQLQKEANEIHAKQLELFESRLPATVEARVKEAFARRDEEYREREQMKKNITENAAKGNVSAG